MHPHKTGVNIESRERTQEVLHHLHAGLTSTQVGPACRLYPLRYDGANRRRSWQISPDEHHALSCRRRLKFDPVLSPAPVANARD